MASGLSGKGHLEDDKFGAIIYRKGIRSDQQGPSNPQNGFGGSYCLGAYGGFHRATMLTMLLLCSQCYS